MRDEELPPRPYLCVGDGLCQLGKQRQQIGESAGAAPEERPAVETAGYIYKVRLRGLSRLMIIPIVRHNLAHMMAGTQCPAQSP